MSKDNGNQQWKSIAVIFGGLLLFWLMFNQVNTPTTTMVYGHMTWGTAPTTSSLLSGLLSIVWNLLWLVLVIGLIGGVFQFIKRFISANNLEIKYDLDQDLKPLLQKIKPTKYICPECKESLDEDFKFCPKCKTSLKTTCSNCGKVLLVNWNCCPACGLEQKAEPVADVETNVAEQEKKQSSSKP